MLLVICMEFRDDDMDGGEASGDVWVRVHFRFFLKRLSPLGT